MSYFFRFLLFSVFCFSLPCVAENDNTTPTVIVSVAPYKNFVEQIAKDTVNVHLMVPAGASSHTFEPTPKQMLSASRADIWFQIGEEFEPRAGKALQSYNKNMAFIDLRKGIDLITSQEGDSNHCHCCHHAHKGCVDPHFWLSPKEVVIQIATIKDALIARFPQNAELYNKNAGILTEKLKSLDAELVKILAPIKGRTILVSHPAYGYLCRDYGLIQLSVEFEGKDPTSKQLTNILNIARQEHIPNVFIQMQYNNKGAKLIADQIGATIVVLDPYAENYFDSMLEIARSFAN